ncbi:MAG: response regulator [Deltaproteobacteria bacterium]|nr:response regulator [Deltaproteobacteria bacterium]MBW2170616.1 response regulator [Deltaproteobacteria bacterium]MBW2258946.1 response regulator [Deltaproteobacteria bacterium]
MDIYPITVLLVEDDEDDYIILRDLLLGLEAGKFRLDWAATYDAAIEQMARNQHDVFLVDYVLGERNGIELLNEAREKGCDAPIILLTGRGDREVDMAAMKAGAADYLNKDEIRAPVLERSIRYAIERKRSEEERLQREKLQVVLEMAGAVCHEMNQPIQVISGHSELMLMDMTEDDPFYEKIKTIEEQTTKMGEITRRLTEITRYETEDYIGSTRIIDIEKASEKKE